MKPFDLEAAMRGEACITRDGRPAKFLYKLKTELSHAYVFILFINNHEEIFIYKQNGQVQLDGNCEFDLFMVPKTKKLWIAIDKNDYETSAFAYESEEELKEASCKARHGAWVVNVEVEE